MEPSYVLTASGQRNRKLERISAIEVSSLPPSYRENTKREVAAIELADKFSRDFSELYPTLPKLQFAPKNEAGVRKILCSTVRPTECELHELYDIEKAVKFVASYITYEPLDPPNEMPSVIPSPGSVLESRVGDCFDMSILLASILLGSGYKAYVVVGQAPAWVSLKNEGLMRCDYVPPADAVDRLNHISEYSLGLHKQPVLKLNNPYTRFKIQEIPRNETRFLNELRVKSVAEHEKFLLDNTYCSESEDSDTELERLRSGITVPNRKVPALEARARRKLQSTLLRDGVPHSSLSKSSQVAFDSSSGAASSRLHCWVMVLPGSRNMTSAVFVEPSTGAMYSVPSPRLSQFSKLPRDIYADSVGQVSYVDNSSSVESSLPKSPYLSVSFLFDHKNIHVNKQSLPAPRPLTANVLRPSSRSVFGDPKDPKVSVEPASLHPVQAGIRPPSAPPGLGFRVPTLATSTPTSLASPTGFLPLTSGAVPATPNFNFSSSLTTTTTQHTSVSSSVTSNVSGQIDKSKQPVFIATSTGLLQVPAEFLGGINASFDDDSTTKLMSQTSLSSFTSPMMIISELRARFPLIDFFEKHRLIAKPTQLSARPSDDDAESELAKSKTEDLFTYDFDHVPAAPKVPTTDSTQEYVDSKSSEIATALEGLDSAALQGDRPAFLVGAPVLSLSTVQKLLQLNASENGIPVTSSSSTANTQAPVSGPSVSSLGLPPLSSRGRSVSGSYSSTGAGHGLSLPPLDTQEREESISAAGTDSDEVAGSAGAVEGVLNVTNNVNQQGAGRVIGMTAQSRGLLSRAASRAASRPTTSDSSALFAVVPPSLALWNAFQSLLHANGINPAVLQTPVDSSVDLALLHPSSGLGPAQSMSYGRTHSVIPFEEQNLDVFTPGLWNSVLLSDSGLSDAPLSVPAANSGAGAVATLGTPSGNVNANSAGIFFHSHKLAHSNSSGSVTSTSSVTASLTPSASDSRLYGASEELDAKEGSPSLGSPVNELKEEGATVSLTTTTTTTTTVTTTTTTTLTIGGEEAAAPRRERENPFLAISTRRMSARVSGYAPVSWCSALRIPRHVRLITQCLPESGRRMSRFFKATLEEFRVVSTYSPSAAPNVASLLLDVPPSSTAGAPSPVKNAHAKDRKHGPQLQGLMVRYTEFADSARSKPLRITEVFKGRTDNLYKRVVRLPVFVRDAPGLAAVFGVPEEEMYVAEEEIDENDAEKLFGASTYYGELLPQLVGHSEAALSKGISTSLPQNASQKPVVIASQNQNQNQNQILHTPGSGRAPSSSRSTGVPVHSLEQSNSNSSLSNSSGTPACQRQKLETCVAQVTEEHFLPGLPSGLAMIREVAGFSRELYFYKRSRPDGLLLRREVFGKKIIDFFSPFASGVELGEIPGLSSGCLAGVFRRSVSFTSSSAFNGFEGASLNLPHPVPMPVHSTSQSSSLLSTSALLSRFQRDSKAQTQAQDANRHPLIKDNVNNSQNIVTARSAFQLVDSLPDADDPLRKRSAYSPAQHPLSIDVWNKSLGIAKISVSFRESSRVLIPPQLIASSAAPVGPDSHLPPNSGVKKLSFFSVTGEVRIVLFPPRGSIVAPVICLSPLHGGCFAVSRAPSLAVVPQTPGTPGNLGTVGTQLYSNPVDRLNALPQQHVRALLSRLREEERTHHHELKQLTKSINELLLKRIEYSRSPIIKQTAFEIAAERTLLTEALKESAAHEDALAPYETDFIRPYLMALRVPDLDNPSVKDATRAISDFRTAFRERLKGRVAVIQRRLKAESEMLVRRRLTQSRQRSKDPVSEREFEEFVTNCTYRIGLLEQRLQRELSQIPVKIAEMDNKIRQDPRFANVNF